MSKSGTEELGGKSRQTEDSEAQVRKWTTGANHYLENSVGCANHYIRQLAPRLCQISTLIYAHEHVHTVTIALVTLRIGSWAAIY